MPPILVPFSSKCVATQIFVLTKLDGRKDFNLRSFLLISSVPERNYLFKVRSWGTRIRCESCSRLRMKTLERCQQHIYGVYIVNCEQYGLIIDFEQANVCWVHIEKISTSRLV